LRELGSPPNSPQHLTRPGFGPPAEPARDVKIIAAARGLHRATHMQAGRAPRCRSHVGLGRAGERLIRWADGEMEPLRGSFFNGRRRITRASLRLATPEGGVRQDD
jgi:hypothetical protein